MSDSIFRRPDPLSVTELVHRIRDVLEAGFADVYVEGEIGSFSQPSSGHMYFTLKDKNAQIQGVFFRMQNRLLRFRPENGMVVVARGRASCYVPRGGLQIIIDTLEPKGAGALALAFEQRKKELAAKGWFDADRKKPVPSLPFTIGIVTSPTAAALYDALRIAFNRHPGLHVILSPTLVQGDQAPVQIAKGIERLVEDGRSEAILVVRGGGSAEDLWAFNEMPVVEAIHHCPIPIITGVGHEVDFTIADFVADLRAPTPTAAAETVVPNIHELLQDIDEIEYRLTRAFSARLERWHDRLGANAHRLRVSGLPTKLPGMRLKELSGRLGRALGAVFQVSKGDLSERKVRLANGVKDLFRASGTGLDQYGDRMKRAAGSIASGNHAKLSVLTSRLAAKSPVHEHRALTVRLDQLRLRLSAEMKKNFDTNADKLKRSESLLFALSPMNVLGRGYSLTRKSDGTIVKSVDQVELDEKLQVVLASGELGVGVLGKKDQDLE